MANEKRLIDANALKTKVFNLTLYVHGLRFGKTVINNILESYRRGVFEEIDNAPTVEAVEVVHAYWIKEYDEHGIDRGWKCSNCKGSVYEMTYEPYKGCPHCLAKMDGDGNG